MTHLIGAALAFFLLHRVISGSGLRILLVTRLGENNFRRVFALASLGCLVWLMFAYRIAFRGDNIALFATPDAANWLQWPLQFVAWCLILAGITTRNPTVAGMDDAVHDQGIVRGVLRITRHPFLWGVSVMSLGHMMVLGDVASWGFFGTLLVLAMTGTFSIDAKRRRSLGHDWTKFAADTSNLPFAAILTLRQRLVLSEIDWRCPIVALVSFALAVAAHVFLRPILAG